MAEVHKTKLERRNGGVVKVSVNKIKFGALKLANYDRVLVGEFTLSEMF